ncbi:MAG: serine/threonine-protein kinase, partial [Burkholderiaceae bacterium]
GDDARAAPTDGPRVAAPAVLRLAANGEIELPAVVGRYKLESVLGRGAMGCVYRGLDAKVGRDIALKTLLPQAEGGSLSGDTGAESSRERFFREAETGGRLKHPGIVTIYDAGEVRGMAYIAMELLHGRDLSHRCREGQLLAPGQVAALMADVAEALGHAHDRKVVHRDIKPANLVWDEASGAIKVTDFGVARLIDTEATSAGLAIGTPAYMAPEQVRGENVDGQTDIYALGATLFHLLTGRLPFVAEQMSALLFRVVNEPAPDPRTLRPDLPAPLAEIVLRAMSKLPRQRHEGGRVLAQELRAVADELGPGGDQVFMQTLVAPAAAR